MTGFILEPFYYLMKVLSRSAPLQILCWNHCCTTVIYVGVKKRIMRVNVMFKDLKEKKKLFFFLDRQKAERD